ncbi:DNA gyrase C-terminal beta-propeller domain-containing protein, partial [Actinomyces radicidentis]
IQGRQCLVVTELPYQVNPDNLADKIAQLVRDGQVGGIADIRDETSGRTGQRLVIVLKRDAVAKVVLNNLYKRTQLQDNFPANMLALVDGVPRTLSLDGFVRHWVNHQVDVIIRRSQYRLRKAEERLHILEGLLKAIDALDAVIALIRRSPTTDEARTGLMGLLGVDEAQAEAILSLQLRRLAALERLKIQQEADELHARVVDLKDIIASPERQRGIVSEELGEIVDKYGDDRRTRIVPFDGEMSMEDLIPEEEVAVTITHSGYAKRTRTDQYRSQHRGGKGVRGAALREDDVVDHFFVTTTHHWLLFFTNLGRVYRAKAYELPEGGRDAKGQHVANLLAFQPGEEIAQIMDLKDYEQADYLVLATRRGLVKKTRLSEYDSNRSGGVIAINLREDEDGVPDELVSARLLSEGQDLLLVSRGGQSVRFRASDEVLRPTGRTTSGVTGMRFRGDDSLLAMDVVDPAWENADLFVVTEGGYAKRTNVQDYPVKGRGGLGVKVANLVEARGDLVGALVTEPGDEVMCIMASGKVVRSAVDEVSRTGRTTQGVTFAKPDKGDRIIAVARNAERELDGDEAPAVDEADGEAGAAPVAPAFPEAEGEVPTGSGASGDTAVPSADEAADAVALSDDDESEAQA